MTAQRDNQVSMTRDAVTLPGCVVSLKARFQSLKLPVSSIISPFLYIVRACELMSIPGQLFHPVRAVGFRTV